MKVVTTISGSKYEFTDDFGMVLRSASMFHDVCDGDWVRCLMVKPPVVGETMWYCLLDRGDADMVHTSVVKSIE